jgi:hypothetical protein
MACRTTLYPISDGEISPVLHPDPFKRLTMQLFCIGRRTVESRESIRRLFSAALNSRITANVTQTTLFPVRGEPYGRYPWYVHGTSKNR